eukprot:scaffold90511_cov63-Phaeocystis_antarctica.AAC.3
MTRPPTLLRRALDECHQPEQRGLSTHDAQPRRAHQPHYVLVVHAPFAPHGGGGRAGGVLVGTEQLVVAALVLEQHHAPTRLADAAHLGQCLDWVGVDAEREGVEDRVEGGVRESEALRIHLQQLDMAQLPPRLELTRLAKHALREVVVEKIGHHALHDSHANTVPRCWARHNPDSHVDAHDRAAARVVERQVEARPHAHLEHATRAPPDGLGAQLIKPQCGGCVASVERIVAGRPPVVARLWLGRRAWWRPEGGERRPQRRAPGHADHSAERQLWRRCHHGYEAR